MLAFGGDGNFAMNWLTAGPLLFVALLLLVALAALLRVHASQLRQRSGLPQGKIVYQDVSGLAKKPLYSSRLRLKGKPDYLLKDQQDNLIPVEVKSGSAPRDGRPYQSQLLQLAAYFVLVEDVLQRPVPYGLIRYRNQTMQIANTEELRAQLFETLAQMRRLLARGTAQRNHRHAQRCARCSVAHACDERLA
jgi:CRISPR-associated exonuclease Cas4